MHDNKQRKKLDVIGCLIPGLPNEYALECLARVPMLSNLWGVSMNWQRLIQSDAYFRCRRRELGLVESPQWLYALLASSSTSGSSDSTRTEWQAYDPLGNQWHTIPPMPMRDVTFQLAIPGFVGHSLSIQTTSTNHQLIVVAGTRGGGGKEAALVAPLIFDARTSSWSQAAPLAVPRRWCASGAASGRLLVASGCGREWDAGVARAAEICDISGGGGGGGGWRSLPSLATCKLSAEATAAVALGGHLHMVSGRGVFAKMGVVLDVASGEWRDMPRGMRSGWCGAAVAACGKIFVVDDTAGRLKVYDESQDAWRILLVDVRLRGLSCLAASPGGTGSKICGINDDGVIRIVDVATDPIHIFEIPRPPVPCSARIVGLQLLSGILR